MSGRLLTGRATLIPGGASSIKILMCYPRRITGEDNVLRLVYQALLV